MHDVAARACSCLPTRGRAMPAASVVKRDVLGFGRVRHALRRHRADAELAEDALPGGGVRQQVVEAGRLEIDGSSAGDCGLRVLWQPTQYWFNQARCFAASAAAVVVVAALRAQAPAPLLTWTRTRRRRRLRREDSRRLARASTAAPAQSERRAAKNLLHSSVFRFLLVFLRPWSCLPRAAAAAAPDRRARASSARAARR